MSTEDLIHKKLEEERRHLLDVSPRNRLLNTPRHKVRSRTIEVVDELSEEMFRILVTDQKPMSFLPSKTLAKGGVSEEGLFEGMSQPEEEEVDEYGVPKRHTDSRLQTKLSSEQLQKRLLGLGYDARMYKEEQGVNILYLALGFLKWFEDDSSDRELYAPLILIPADLHRESAKSRFKISYSGEEMDTNLSLQASLKTRFGIDLPEIGGVEDLSLESYFAKVSDAVANVARWEILRNDAVLGFFSFSKFLMYRDLDPKNWPPEKTPGKHTLITGLLEEGFTDEGAGFGENENVDALIPPADMVHVLDADSSQALAIEEVRQGRNLLIQGPPGTGKSQTIANLIAMAVKEGKTVLFVAEKMAALNVVKRRLDNIHVGDACAELHSHKANKRQFLEELRRTLELGRPGSSNWLDRADLLQKARNKLNHHADLMNSPLGQSGLEPYRVIGELVKLQARGVTPTEYRLEGCLAWPEEKLRETRSSLRDVVAHLASLGTPAKHVWRGVMLEAVLPTDVQRLATQLPKLIERTRAVLTKGASLMKLLGLQRWDGSAHGLFHLAAAGHRAVCAPRLDRDAIAAPAWEGQRQAISELIAKGQVFRETEQALDGKVTEAAWTTDVGRARAALATRGKSLFRWLNGDYRRALAVLRTLSAGEPPKALGERLELLDTLTANQDARAHIKENSDLGQQAFGSLWSEGSTDWASLDAIASWESENSRYGDPATLRLVAHAAKRHEEIGPASESLADALRELVTDLKGMFESVQLSIREAFRVEGIRAVPLKAAAARLEGWHTSVEALTKWIGCRTRLEKLREQGVSEIADRLYDGRITPDQAEDSLMMAYFEAVMRDMIDQEPALATFDGGSHERSAEEFRASDREWIERVIRSEVALAHYEHLPRGNGDLGEMGIIRHEISKKTRHLPLRQLLKKAGRAVQKIKPVFMMSPLSVAKFLEPGELEFDLLLVDEASQIQPVDALGAIARTKQMVVVGDDKQLPPTNFFTMTIEDDERRDDDEDARASDLESILGLCRSRNVPARMLRWHYRSRHHSLIAVSNREFYDDRLYVIPSPTEDDKELGLRLNYLSGGTYDRGGSRTNRTEARAVAKAALEHARRHPDLSLGVGTFSLSQRDAVLDELEHLWREEANGREFFSPGQPEPFFVKNLETIQGDERDVIFLSVGYGPDESGYMTMTFGPLSKDGGERRLNVLITRARMRCEIFSSVRADDIDLRRATGPGPRALKAFLSYAETGILDVGVPTDRGFESPFEEEVARAIAASGYEVIPQVGVAGFFVDLAVIDPDLPGRYLLGIECDGASYHSARWARDRDRLRQAVLEDRGWIIHRIWSADWFHRRDEQLRKTLGAIDAAKAELAKRDDDQSSAPASEAKGSPAFIREDGTDNDDAYDDLSSPYICATFDVPKHRPIHEIEPHDMAEIVGRIVDVEGPVHEEEVARRVVDLWGLQRVGNRIAETVKAGLDRAQDEGTVVNASSFYTPTEQAVIPVRNRASAPAALKRIDMLPPEELSAAVLRIVTTHMGVLRDNAIRAAARLLGYQSTSDQLRGQADRELCQLISRGLIRDDAGRLYASSTED
ncbi:MAG: DUF3320 domain-containing protein [Planctomycetota bacterium]|jgi:very-short-patch-repair endonuclease/DNA polymerase III delta prime subunit